MKSGPYKTTTAEALLGMLSLEAMSGYELKRLIEESVGNFWSESFGQIYPTLKRLQQEGFVTAAEGDRAGSTIYALTEAGWGRLREWLGVMPRPQVARSELLLKLFFGSLQPLETVRAQIAEERRRLAGNLARYDSIAAHIQRVHGGNPGLPYWLMTVRYGQAEARALVAWCDECLAELETKAAHAVDRGKAQEAGR